MAGRVQICGIQNSWHSAKIRIRERSLIVSSRQSAASPALPKNANGKIDRSKLKELFLEAETRGSTKNGPARVARA